VAFRKIGALTFAGFTFKSTFNLAATGGFHTGNSPRSPVQFKFFFAQIRNFFIRKLFGGLDSHGNSPSSELVKSWALLYTRLSEVSSKKLFFQNFHMIAPSAAPAAGNLTDTGWAGWAR
jgi:hypothetical protein